MMRGVRSELPSGTVTFVFTDVEGSTKLLHELGAEAYAEALAAHRRIVREACGAHDGVEVDTQGDAFFVAFPTAPGAVAAAVEATEHLAVGPIRVRVGVHTGTPYLGDEGYVGVDVHRAARVAACGHGGQVLLTTTTAGLVGHKGLLDLGEHRLKDLSAPERIFQLGDVEFPPLKSLHRTNLPIPATPFLGRQRELVEVSGLLAQDAVRLLTLTGPGGTGKTRLGLQAAAEAADRFPGGVFWVPLASLRDPRLVLPTAGQAVGANDDIAEHIRDRALLLLLDNFEHVMDAADDLAELLAACPNLRLLVTSRELLRLPAEQAYQVPSLRTSEGVELFVARARAADSRFEPTAAVDELCGRLEQLPLALELAAARVTVLTPEQLLERLAQRLDILKAGRGSDARQQTLRATIEWSHDLLDCEERQLFARLAVFSGGCTLEAVESVAGADLDVLQALVDKSLVRMLDGGRFWMLETIREYAAEQLASSEERDALGRSHAEYFLDLADTEDRHLIDEAGVERLDELEREQDNLRLALAWFDAAGETQSLQQLFGALVALWAYRGPLAEGIGWSERALAETRPTVAHARVLAGAAELAALRGDPQTAQGLAEEALRLYQTFGDSFGIAISQQALAYSFTEMNEPDRAQRMAEESVRGFEAIGAEHRLLWATRTLAYISLLLGQNERGRKLHEANLLRARNLGNRRVEATTLGALALLWLHEGRLCDALPMLIENMPIFEEVGTTVDVATNLTRIAAVLATTDEVVAATELLAHTGAVFEEVGVDLKWVTRNNDEALEHLHTQLNDEAFHAAWATGAALSTKDAIQLGMVALAAAQEALSVRAD